MTSTIDDAMGSVLGDKVSGFEFVVRLNRAPSDDEINVLFELGLDDALVGGIDMFVSRVAPDLPTAVGQVVGQVSNVPGLFAVGLSHVLPPEESGRVSAHDLDLLDLLDTMIKALSRGTLSAGDRSAAAALLLA